MTSQNNEIHNGGRRALTDGLVAARRPSSKETMMRDDYLGDGVYASHDGYHIVLDLRGQDDYTKIALEPTVFDALVWYKERVDAEILQRRQDGAKSVGAPRPHGS